MSYIESEKYVRSVTLIGSMTLFGCSLTQQCYCTTNQCGDSIMAVLAGWLGIYSGGAALTWLANPFLWVSWIFIKKNLKLSGICCIVSLLISLSFLLFNEVIDDEAGHYNKIISHKMGYWLWLASPLIMSIGNLISYASKQKMTIK